MVTADPKSRVVLAQDVRDRLGLSPGTEVDAREEGGKAIVEFEDDPERIIERRNDFVADTAADREPDSHDELDPAVQDHADTLRRRAREARSADE